jgi:hypothetical protein
VRCIGIRVPGYDGCLAHLNDADRARVFERLKPGSNLDASGTTFTTDLLNALLKPITDPKNRRATFGEAKFERTTFGEAVDLRHASFIGAPTFEKAEFYGAAHFDDSSFGQPPIFDGAIFSGPARFDNATLQGCASFRAAKFNDDATFSEATFEESPDGTCADFDDAAFAGYANFEGANFKGQGVFLEDFYGAVTFMNAKFNDHASFGGTSFNGSANFQDAEFAKGAGFECDFGGDALFSGAQFDGEASFLRATFDGRATFWQTAFRGEALFNWTTFDSRSLPTFGGAEFLDAVEFRDVDFKTDIDFDGAEFYRTPDLASTEFRKLASFKGVFLHDMVILGPLRAKSLDLSELRAGTGVSVRCSVEEIVASNMHCPEGLNLQLDGSVHVDASQTRSVTDITFNYVDGQLTIADAAFASPTIIATPTALSGDLVVSKRVFPAPRLVALERVDAQNLTLSGLDLGACRLLSCYNRDKLHIEGPLQFIEPPTTARWTRRQALADEHYWRARFDRRPDGWFPTECRRAGEKTPRYMRGERKSKDALLEASRIQGVYRDLRKGREDAKDEPSAADFYYGEMEMRRLSARPGGFERILLTVYWALSGYGLRAARALTALIILLTVGTVGFATVGFAPSNRVEFRPAEQTAPSQPVIYRQVTVPGSRPGWGAAVDQSVNSATALLRPTVPRPLTGVGQAVEGALRLLGPILLGLAILAVRGRVKR